jgi:drug/metabolite transporter (DMT)-like permease
MKASSSLAPARPSRRAALTGAALVLLSSIAFSGKAVMAKLMYRAGAEPITVLALRMGFALPVFLLAAAWTARVAQPLSRREWGAALSLGGVAYYLSAVGDFMGLRFVSAGLERLILFTYPTLVVLMSSVALRERIGQKQLFALSISYAGIALVFRAELRDGSPGEHALLGAGLVFASAITYAAYLVGSTRYIRRLGSLRFTAIALSAASVSTLLHFLAAGPPLLGHPASVYGLGLAMALLATVLPAFALAAGIQRIGPSVAAILGTIGPVSTLFLAHWFLSEPISPMQLLGTALVLLGATLVARPERSAEA